MGPFTGTEISTLTVLTMGVTFKNCSPITVPSTVQEIVTGVQLVPVVVTGSRHTAVNSMSKRALPSRCSVRCSSIRVGREGVLVT